ncbi:MAG TPA: hypothetical protein VGF55_18810 [Gemmataceae bacterium]|jgi:hypothetical protein
MPSRPVTLAIVAFWLLTAGWFVARDVLPHWRTGDPPPFTIEFADEALKNVFQRWTALRNGEKIGTIKTGQAYQESDDTFELSAAATQDGLRLAAFGPVTITAREFHDRVRINRDGELRAVATDATLALNGAGPEMVGRFRLSAAVRGGRLERHALFEVPGLVKSEPVLEPTDPPRGRVLNPMHPVPRITGLRPGQEWRQPLIDPRSDLLRAALTQLAGGRLPGLPDPPTELAARVLPEPEVVSWNSEQHVCYVIEYRGGEDYVAHTWVRVSDGAVMRQEADAHGETLVLQRE